MGWLLVGVPQVGPIVVRPTIAVDRIGWGTSLRVFLLVPFYVPQFVELCVKFSRLLGF